MGKLSGEFLDLKIFDTLLEAKVLIERRRVEYNMVRPDSSMGYYPPEARQVPTAESKVPKQPHTARNPLGEQVNGVTLGPQMRKPLDIMVKGLSVPLSGGKGTPIELFLEGIAGWINRSQQEAIEYPRLENWVPNHLAF
ncbi:MAG: integrase core domain-containing protein [Planctomycetaceae bacterium]|nr:integrase core domain-containing protein [Planctomycetaceae bacterium]